MTPDAWIALGVCAFVASLFGLSLLVPRRNHAAPSTDGRLDALARRVDEVETVAKEALHDVRGVRMSLVGLATKDSVTALALQVAEMRGDMKSVSQTMEALKHSTIRIEGFLMQSAADVIASQKGSEPKS